MGWVGWGRGGWLVVSMLYERGVVRVRCWAGGLELRTVPSC